MRRVVVALLVVGCGSSPKTPDVPPTPTERQQPAREEPATQEPARATSPDAPAPITDADLEMPPRPASSKPEKQAEIAWQSANDGIAHFRQGNFEAASNKFRNAVAREPEPRYFYLLCISLYQEGRFSEALTACDVASKGSRVLDPKAQKMMEHIRTEAGRQDIKVE